jgi:cysteine desulfurase
MTTFPIYLDHNATTPVLPEILEQMLPWFSERYGNPGCSHHYGAQAAIAVETARQQVATLIGCTPSEIVFTSGGTEANNLATMGLFRQKGPGLKLITSAIEHPAIAMPSRYLAEVGHPTEHLPVDATGLVDPSGLTKAVTGQRGLVSVMHSNNEVGTIQPIAELAAIAHESGFWMHTDAAQSVGKTRIKVDELGVDLLSIAGHKLYAPKGIGALYVRDGTPIGPLHLGAGHEGGLRPGTEPVALIAGLGQACAIAERESGQREKRLKRLRDDLHEALLSQVPGLRLHGHPVQRLPNTLNLGFPGVSGSQLLAHCPGIAASTGSACHEHGEEPSGVLTAMGLPREHALEAVRLTLGTKTTAEQIHRASTALVNAWRALRA